MIHIPFESFYFFSEWSLRVWVVDRSRILRHRFGTRLLVAGCLLLGAGFLIKLDTTGPCGKFLSSGMKGCWVLSREHCHGVW